MSGKEYPLSLIIRAVDRASGPLDRVTARLERMNAPFARLGASAQRFGKRFSAFSEQAGLNKMGGAFKGVGSAMGRVGSEVFSLGTKFAALGVLAGAAFFHFIKSGSDAGDVLAKTSDRLGVTIDYFAQMSFVAGRAGVSAEELTSGFDKFNKALGQSKMGTGALHKALQSTPASFQKQFKAAKTNEEKLDLMFVAMSKIPDASKRAAFAAEIFGKTAGPKMTAMVQSGIGEIGELRAEFFRMNGSQEAFARSSEKLNDAMGDVDAAFGGVKVAIMAELFPALVQLAGVVKEFLIDNRKGLAQWAKDTAAAIEGWVKGGGIDRLSKSFRKFLDVVDPIVSKLGGWPMVLGGIAAAIVGGPLLGALGSFAVAMTTLGAAMLTTPVGWFLGAVALIAGAALLVIKNWEPVKGFFKEWFPNLSTSIENAATGIAKLVEWFNLAVEAKRRWENMGKLGEQAYQGRVHSTPDEQLGPLDRIYKFATRNNPRLDAGAARPGAGGAGVRQAPAQAQVTIDVNGPKGTKVTAAPDNTADVNTSLGITNQ